MNRMVKCIFEKEKNVVIFDLLCMYVPTKNSEFSLNVKNNAYLSKYTMFSVYAVSNYAVLHLCGTRKWSKFLLYAAIFSHYAVFVQNHSI